MIVAYVSGHGFGHATRVTEVLREVRRLSPRTPLAVVTSGPERLYRRSIPGPLTFRFLACDVGLVQSDALTIDEAGTVARWREFRPGARAWVEAETRWLEAQKAHLILADIPPLAFEAAAQAGVPSVGLANFSWDWIYAYLSARHPELAGAAAEAAGGYERAELLLELPFAGDLSAFPRREAIPLVARRPRVDRAEARRLLGLSDRPAVLISFGGLGLPGFRADVLGGLQEFDFLAEQPAEGLPSHVRSLTTARLEACGLGYQDVVGAADVVVSKPGYGIVSDCVGARTRLVYTERGDFPEYPILVSEMPRYLPAVHVSNRDLMAGRLRDPLREALERPFPPPPDATGALVAARRLLGF